MLRAKKDFGITAAVIMAITVAATSAAAAGTALALSVPTPQVLNNLTSSTGVVLSTQSAINQHLYRGIMLLNQQVDLLQEQMNIIPEVLTSTCVTSMTGLCITSTQYTNLSRAANISKHLGTLLNGTWTFEFDKLTQTLRQEISSLNASRVDIAKAMDFISWVNHATSFAKQWAGVGALFILFGLGFLLLIRFITSIRASVRRDRLIFQQAMVALKTGSSPQVWLSILDR